ncbi:3315_t:CDS:1 [Ambispora leptoticha]|uniref:3315_t:CDS:1 n=1 Tax=Ambispora leptoticha TaxID=144679 RepID=A0A9N9A3K2_9GLOM|nr:3315_t:CDS:1 [Ambispora leptoticha]
MTIITTSSSTTKDNAQCPATSPLTRRSAANNSGGHANNYSGAPRYYRKPAVSHYKGGKRTRRNVPPNAQYHDPNATYYRKAAAPNSRSNRPSSTFVRRHFLENMFPPPPTEEQDECVICAYPPPPCPNCYLPQCPPPCAECYPAYYPPPCPACYQEEYNGVAYPYYPPPCPQSCPVCNPCDD